MLGHICPGEHVLVSELLLTWLKANGFATLYKLSLSSCVEVDLHVVYECPCLQPFWLQYGRMFTSDTCF